MNGSGSSNTSGANQAKLRFKSPQENDRVSQSAIEELSRRGFVVIEVVAPGNVLIQVNEPEDKTKVWWPSDVNGIPQGSPRVWNEETGKWEPIQIANSDPYVPPQRRSGTLFAPAAGSQQTAQFESMKTSRYFVWLTPSLLKDGVWLTPPATVPAHFGYMLTGQAENTFTVLFFGIPTGGLTWNWMIEELPEL